jgi:PEP-CTERM motif
MCKFRPIAQKMRESLWVVALLLLATATGARADSVTFTTPGGSTTGGQPVDASVTIVTNADGSIDITLKNLEANPKSVVQAISDLDFTLSNGATTGTLASSSGQEITVASNGTFTLGSTVDTGWTLNDNVGGGLQLNVLGTPTGPAHLIIGPPGPGNIYSNANGSIAGNGPHNPFLNQTAIFVVDVPGVTDATTIETVTFSFGTTAGNDVPGTPSVPAPEPSSIVLLGTGLLAVIGQIRKRPAS